MSGEQLMIKSVTHVPRLKCLPMSQFEHPAQRIRINGKEPSPAYG